MKKRCLFIFLILLVLLSSCAKKTQPFISNSDEKVKYEKTNTDGINGVYLITDKGPAPVAYTDNGKLNLAGDVYYYNIKNILESDDAVKQKSITLFDEKGFNKGSLTYSELQNKKEPAYKMLALTGKWRLCPDMRYIEYSKNSAPPTEYVSFISEAFKDKFKNQPDITECWETDIDCDDNNEAIVKAKTDKYVVIALMSTTMGNNILYSDFENKTDAFPFFADLDGNGKPSLLLLKGDTLKTIDVYKEGESQKQYSLYLPVV